MPIISRPSISGVCGKRRPSSGLERPCRGKSGEISGANMRKSNVALRLQPSLFEEAKRVAEAEGVALNQLINVAVAEKLSALRTDEYFRVRAARGNVAKAKRILKRTGRGKPPVAGAEIE